MHEQDDLLDASDHSKCPQGSNYSCYSQNLDDCVIKYSNSMNKKGDAQTYQLHNNQEHTYVVNNMCVSQREMDGPTRSTTTKPVVISYSYSMLYL